MCPTKAGKGYKVVVEGKWYYTSLGELTRMLAGKVKACRFRSIENEEGAATPSASLLLEGVDEK